MSFQIIAGDIAKVDTVQLTDPIIIGVTGTNLSYGKQVRAVSIL
jgi:hypothetical protein